MFCSRIALLLLLAVLGLGVAACGGDDDDAGAEATTEAAETTAETTGTTETGAGGESSTLRGSVGPGFDISLDGTDGLTAGSYTIVVDDQASAHNFHLTGPGVDVQTDVGDEGEETFEVELQAGEYTFVCDPHASSMNGSFTVG
jgi:Copper binding proteins, plastocyanin/azurin family